MSATESVESLSPIVERIDLQGRNLLSINDLSNSQILTCSSWGAGSSHGIDPLSSSCRARS